LGVSEGLWDDRHRVAKPEGLPELLGLAQRAAKVLVDWAKGTAPEDDDASPVGAPVRPRGADADGVASVVDSTIEGQTEATP
jgi:hypothetical protein